MKATELAHKLLDAATAVGDFEIECRNGAGDLDFVEAVLARPAFGQREPSLVITTDCDEQF